MAKYLSGDAWAFGRGNRIRSKRARNVHVSLVAAMTAVSLLAMTGIAGADALASDGDTFVASSNVTATCTARTASSSATLSYSNAGGNRHFAPNQSLAVSVSPDSPINVSGAPSELQITTWAAGSSAGITFTTNVPANTATGAYKVNVEVSGKDTSNVDYSLSDFFNVNVTCESSPPTNTVPAISAASFSPNPVACGLSTTLSATFSDPDNGPWTAYFDWDNDGTFDESKNETEAGTFSQSHTYASPGAYTAAVKVVDSLGAESDTRTAQVTVNQTYSMQFLRPFDQSIAGSFVINQAKAGRVVPVKVTITDDCTGLAVDGSGSAPSVRVNQMTNPDSSETATDLIENYADAGASNGNDKYFRWVDGFWIYNLDTKALSLTTGKTYRVDVFVGTVKASDDEFGLLKTVK